MKFLANLFKNLFGDQSQDALDQDLQKIDALQINSFDEMLQLMRMHYRDGLVKVWDSINGSASFFYISAQHPKAQIVLKKFKKFMEKANSGAWQNIWLQYKNPINNVKAVNNKDDEEEMENEKKVNNEMPINIENGYLFMVFNVPILQQKYDFFIKFFQNVFGTENQKFNELLKDLLFYCEWFEYTNQYTADNKYDPEAVSKSIEFAQSIINAYNTFNQDKKAFLNYIKNLASYWNITLRYEDLDTQRYVDSTQKARDYFKIALNYLIEKKLIEKKDASKTPSWEPVIELTESQLETLNSVINKLLDTREQHQELTISDLNRQINELSEEVESLRSLSSAIFP